MSRKIRRPLAAFSVMAALFLALPAPSHAAGFLEWRPSPGLVAWVWTWLEDLGFGTLGSRPPGSPISWWEKEGSGINPDGSKVPGINPTQPPASTAGEEGSMIEPNG